jgi:hypothetical protein
MCNSDKSLSQLGGDPFEFSQFFFPKKTNPQPVFSLNKVNACVLKRSLTPTSAGNLCWKDSIVPNFLPEQFP